MACHARRRRGGERPHGRQVPGHHFDSVGLSDPVSSNAAAPSTASASIVPRVALQGTRRAGRGRPPRPGPSRGQGGGRPGRPSKRRGAGAWEEVGGSACRGRRAGAGPCQAGRGRRLCGALFSQTQSDAGPARMRRAGPVTWSCAARVPPRRAPAACPARGEGGSLTAPQASVAADCRQPPTGWHLPIPHCRFTRWPVM
jgi:hypothetical protein